MYVSMFKTKTPHSKCMSEGRCLGFLLSGFTLGKNLDERDVAQSIQAECNEEHRQEFGREDHDLLTDSDPEQSEW